MVRNSKNGIIATGRHLPYDPILVKRAKELRKNMTESERKLWFGFLRKFKYPVLRQRPIGYCIVDFYCAQLGLAIEIDGDSHYKTEGKKRDKTRTEELEKYGLRVLRFTNDDVLKNFEGVCQVIEAIPPNPPY